MVKWEGGRDVACCAAIPLVYWRDGPRLSERCGAVSSVRWSVDVFGVAGFGPLADEQIVWTRTCSEQMQD